MCILPFELPGMTLLHNCRLLVHRSTYFETIQVLKVVLMASRLNRFEMQDLFFQAPAPL